ncbi:putative WD repeat-containing protein [Habropoda laboriosa]|uniref:Putative WD repeat-containing protein n=1 Tax=Habropoda laboriosa TaxID=597456 RepID=A0A0L7R146_9HYME|nr:putative WD repeat-containing protein [Habropoda laboriosa]
MRFIPVYEDLSSDKLLKRCEGGRMQNNKSLNSVIWSITPKTTSVINRVDGVQPTLPRMMDHEQISAKDVEHDILCLCYTETYDFLVAGLTNGSVKLYKTNSEDVLTLCDTEMMQKPSPTTAIKHRPVRRSYPITRTVTATYANGCVKCWHYPTSQCLYTIREKRQVLGLAYHSHLPKFVTLGDDARLVLYDEETKMQERGIHASESLEVMDGHKSRVFSACFNPKSAHELISAGWDNTIQFWDTRQPYALRHILTFYLGIRRNGDLLTNNFYQQILSCAWQRENPIQLWDYGSGKLLVSLEPDSYSSLLYCGKYVSNMFLACGGTDVNLFRVVDLRSHATLAMIRNVSGGTYSLDTGLVNPKHAKKTRTISVVPQLAFCAGRQIFEIDAQPS